MNLLKEFKPALLFLAKFLGLYFTANILYGIYIESYDRAPDPITRVVTSQTSSILNAIGYNATYHDIPEARKIALKEESDVVLYVYEGCNGINVAIVFMAFLFAFGGPIKNLFVFLLSGLLMVHLFNLLRIGLLFYLALNNASQFYYYHKYLFTSTLYFVVFALWAVWVICLNETRDVKASG